MTDPTVQPSGDLVVYFLNSVYGSTYLYQGRMYGLFVTPNPPSYAPLTAPPPEWKQPTDYETNAGTIPTRGTLVPDSSHAGYALAYGAGWFYMCKDLRSTHVLPAKQYIFNADVSNGDLSHQIRFYWVISGDDQGSTVLPGFGLYNLPTNPNAWTYLVPPAFTGSFGMRLMHPSFADVVTLTVDYRPFRAVDGWAGLIFGVQASHPSDPLPGPKADEAPPTPEVKPLLEIVSSESESEFEVVDGPSGALPDST